MLGCFLTVAIMATAQTNIYKMDFRAHDNSKTLKAEHRKTLSDKTPSKACMSRAGGDTHTVTIKLTDFNEEEYSPNFGSVFLSGGIEESAWGYPDDNGTFIFENVPEGKCDFVLTLQSLGNGICCYVKEGVEVNSDMELTGLLADCTNHVAFNAYLPNGELPLSIYDDEESDFRQDGNSWDATLTTDISTKHGGDLGRYQIGFDITIEDGMRIDRGVNGDVWSNSTDFLKICQDRLYITPKGSVLMAMEANGCATQTVTTTADMYTEHDFNDMFALVANNYEGADGYETVSSFRSVAYTTYVDNQWCSTSIGTFNGTFEWDALKYYISNGSGNFLSIAANPVKDIIAVGNNNEGSIGTFGICAPVTAVTPEVVSYAGRHDFPNSTNYPGFLPDLNLDFAYPVRYPLFSNPEYQWAEGTTGSTIFGTTVPVTVFLRFGNQFSYDFIGSLGEKRTIDFLNGQFKLTRDGEVICKSYPNFMQLMENSRQLTKKGPWDFFIYDDNITVDGLQGHNTTEIHLEKTGDAMAPTLVQLVARDKENNIRNIYDNASEGKITFSAGAFAYNFEGSKQGYLYTPLSELTVEYSGYRSGNWKRLEVSEISGKFFMPGYGAYYEAPLDQIEGGGQNGWFDLHFKLVDPNGNVQTQTISPAFCVKSLSSIESIGTDNGTDATVSAVYNLQGMRLQGATPAPGQIIIECLNNGTTRVVKR